MRKSKTQFPQKPSPYDIKNEAIKSFSRKQAKQAKQTPKTPLAKSKQIADKLNDELNYAGTKLKGGSDKISSMLLALLIDLSGDPYIKAGEENKYFKVDEKFDGDMNKLFQHVTFKEIPETNTSALRYIEKIEEDPHTTPEAYKQYEQQWHHQSYNTLAGRLKLDNYEVLEQIMNSSAAWQIAKRSAMDSEQVLERWQDLYDTMNDAVSTDEGIFDWAIQEIENGKHSIDWLINAIDDEIRLSLAGKYSQRRKVHY